ncbi:MAG: hypothetical protein A2X49_07085 [Lentisphaerae bacterium GWF2_52_8]|nr:MAG: hypothetical protein A2X49_07085 [Lentisphaerae bacterium GWF2_52_8]
MLTQELIAQVRKIEIKTKRIVEEITGGAYHSVFKGRGLEFSEVREYTPEDDVRDIDWNVTARMGVPFIKKYTEERELTVMLAVDASASGLFGSGIRSKNQRAIETAALLALSAIRNHDKVGLLLFTDRTELYLPPRSGRSHSLRLIRELMAVQPKGHGTDIGAALETLMHVLHKKSVIFLISDLIDEHDYEKTLKIAGRRHDMVAVRISDPLEEKWPCSANIMLEDAESGSILPFPGKNRKVCSSRNIAAQEDRIKKQEKCARAQVDLIDVSCDGDLVAPFLKFFKKRRRQSS